MLIAKTASKVKRTVTLQLTRRNYGITVGCHDRPSTTRTAQRRTVTHTYSSVRHYSIGTLVIGNSISGRRSIITVIRRAISFFNKLSILIGGTNVRASDPSRSLSISDFSGIVSIGLQKSFLYTHRAVGRLLTRNGTNDVVGVSDIRRVVPHPRCLDCSVDGKNVNGLAGALTLRCTTRNVQIGTITPKTAVAPVGSS